MHVGYFNDSKALQMALLCIKKLMPDIQWVEAMPDRTTAQQQACHKARNYTTRSKILVVAPQSISPIMPFWGNNEIVPADNIGQICQAIATSNDRIAAIIIPQQNIAPYYARKVRELASAEGALLIWDLMHEALETEKLSIKISKSSQPDLLCFRVCPYPNLTWLAGREQF